jgi:hypothetical protein
MHCYLAYLLYISSGQVSSSMMNGQNVNLISGNNLVNNSVSFFNQFTYIFSVDFRNNFAKVSLRFYKNILFLIFSTCRFAYLFES